jgi:hypothetical protein
MANRFWGNAPIAEYSPMTMQESMFGPQELYKRDQALTSQVDAMNEANLTLQGALGEAAPKQEEFTKKYNELLSKISKDGATQKNVDDARQLRQLYATQVLPMQDFAKTREKYGAEYFKARMDGDNIIDGANPLEKSFDEYRKDPSALNSFRVVSRDKLTGLGVAYGKNYAQGVTDRDKSDLDLGIMNFVHGFKTQEDAFKAYQSDPKFQGLVNAQVSEIAKSRGLDPTHTEVRSAITGGIMSGVVGGLERAPVSAQYMKENYKSKNGAKETQTNFIDWNDSESLNILEPSDDVLSLAAENPEKKKELDIAVRNLTDKKYDYDGMQRRIAEENQKWRDYTPSVMDRSGLFDPDGLVAKREQLKDILRNDPYFTHTQRFKINKGQIADLGKTQSEEVLYNIRQTLDEPLKYGLISGDFVDKGYSSEDNDLLKKIKDGSAEITGSEVTHLGFQGKSLVDKTGLRSFSGTGKPFITVLIEYKEGTKRMPARAINIKPTSELYFAAKKALNVMHNPITSSQMDQDATSAVQIAEDKHRESKVGK